MPQENFEFIQAKAKVYEHVCKWMNSSFTIVKFCKFSLPFVKFINFHNYSFNSTKDQQILIKFCLKRLENFIK